MHNANRTLRARTDAPSLPQEQRRIRTHAAARPRPGIRHVTLRRYPPPPARVPWVLAVIQALTEWVPPWQLFDLSLSGSVVEVRQSMQDVGFITDAVAVSATSRRTGRRVLVNAGAVPPRRLRGLKGSCLSFAEREEIPLGRAAGESPHSIGRSPSSVRRELARTRPVPGPAGQYRAVQLTPVACGRASLSEACEVGNEPGTRWL